MCPHRRNRFEQSGSHCTSPDPDPWEHLASNPESIVRVLLIFPIGTHVVHFWRSARVAGLRARSGIAVLNAPPPASTAPASFMQKGGAQSLAGLRSFLAIFKGDKQRETPPPDCISGGGRVSLRPGCPPILEENNGGPFRPWASDAPFLREICWGQPKPGDR